MSSRGGSRWFGRSCPLFIAGQLIQHLLSSTNFHSSLPCGGHMCSTSNVHKAAQCHSISGSSPSLAHKPQYLTSGKAGLRLTRQHHVPPSGCQL